MFLFLKHKLLKEATLGSMALFHSSLVPVTDSKAVSIAVDLLKSGQIIAVPTDTVYGLACSASKPESIGKLYTIKGRHENKPLAICLGKVSDIENWAHVSHLSPKLLHRLLPGPVTIVLNCTSNFDKSLLLSGKVGIRIPNNDFIRSVARQLQCPIALTSANSSGEPSTIHVNEFEALWPKLAAVFNAGLLCQDQTNRSASTVVDLSVPGRYKLIRSGIVPQQTCSVLEEFGLKLMT